MKRSLEVLLEAHLKAYDQMIFITGPRQVGKSTLANMCKAFTDHFVYLNWDNLDHRKRLTGSVEALAQYCALDVFYQRKPIVVFDEIYKNQDFKTWLKGFYDTYKSQCHIIVTGSAKWDLFQKVGDSLMGRYLLYQLHPFSVSEVLQKELSEHPFSKPQEITQDQWTHLVEFGGFPDPFLKHKKAFYTHWLRLRRSQFFYEDLRGISLVKELDHLELLASILEDQVCSLVSYSSLANKVNVSIDTIKRWIALLVNCYYIYRLSPWKKNVVRSLLKEPKYYLWDWGVLKDPAKIYENMMAGHLNKAVQYWNQLGQGYFSLHFLRDKEKREVDFCVVKDEVPWLLVEVKSSSQSISPSLYYFQEKTQAQYAFQVCFESNYVDKDCFKLTKPTIVPAKTFLSQLL